MSFSIRDHILYRNGVKVEQRPTKKLSAGRVLKGPIGLTIHYTAGLTAESAISTLTTAKVQASAHLVIDRDGTVYQLAPLNAVCWHAGPSSWGGRSMCNSFMIGIELVNAGPLLKKANGKLYFDVAKSRECSKDDAVEGRQKLWPNTVWWQSYPQEQLDALIEIAREMQREYNIAEKNIVGHENIAPTRKSDPGPAFPMVSFKGAVFGRGDDDNETVRIATKKGVVEKPHEELTAKDLLAAGSETIGAVVTAKRAVGVGLAAGGITVGSVASEPNEALQQVQTTAQTITDTAQAVSTAKDSMSALAGVGHWFATHWIVVVVAAAVVSIGVAFYYIWRAAQIIEQRRVEDARTGANIGRL
jgi:N-acetylmuramoyl-L-alanine amidase